MERALHLALASTVIVLAACSADEIGMTRRRDGGPGGGDAGGGEVCTDDGDCTGGFHCSVTGRCIADGTCNADGDCTGVEHCGFASRRCLGDGACVADGDCPGGMTCDEAMGRCMIGTGCGGSEFPATKIAPNMMILLDRSGSMDGDVGGRTRWDVAKEAVQMVTTSYDAEIRFGLATYSSCLPGGCSAGSIVVPIAPMNAAAINGFLAPLRGRGSSSGTPPDYLCDSGDPETSTGRSLFALVGEPTLQDTTRENHVLLITDGGENSECRGGGMDGESGAAALLAQMPSVRTYVVGFTSDVDEAALARVATAGGTAMYYAADDAPSLIAALDAIGGSVASCEYSLTGSVPDPTMIFVYFNDDPIEIPNDPANGWTYDPATMTLTFHGAPCTDIQGGSVMDIDVVYGCEGPVLE